jgi:hypothetical protein
MKIESNVAVVATVTLYRGAGPGTAIESLGAVRGSAVLIYNPIAKVCSIENWKRTGLPKYLTSILLLKVSHQVTSLTVEKTHSKISGGTENW